MLFWDMLTRAENLVYSKKLSYSSLPQADPIWNIVLTSGIFSLKWNWNKVKEELKRW